MFNANLHHRSYLVVGLLLVATLGHTSETFAQQQRKGKESSSGTQTAIESSPIETQEPTEADLQRVLRQIADEPSIEDVQSAALDFYELKEETIDSFQSRASTKALMPKIGGEFRQNGVDTTIDKWNFVEFPGRKAGQDLIFGQLWEYKVGASWDLPQLMYNPEVLDIYSVRQLRAAVLQEVTRLFYLRRRLLIEYLLQPPKDPKTKIAKLLRVEEIQATIDAMTNGIYAQFERKKSGNTALSQP